MRRPMVYICAFLAIGIIFGQCSFDLSIVLFALVMAYLTAVVLYKYKLKGVILLPVAAMLGFVISYSAVAPKNIAVYMLAGSNQSAEIKGRAKSVGDGFIVVGTEEVNGQSANVNVKCYTAENIAVGDVVRFKADINTFNGGANPSDYNEIYYNKARGIDYKAYAEDIEIVGHKNTLGTYLHLLRGKIKSVYDEILPPNEAGIIKAVVLGDKSDLSEDIKLLYQNAGIYHIIAISGLHIAIIALLLSYIFKKFEYMEVGIIAGLWVYCIFTGCSVSTLRATIIITVSLIGQLVSREGDLINSTAFAGVLILLFSPLYLFDIGFQLSFSAVLGIGIFTNLIKNKFGENIFTEVLGVSIGAGIMTKPVILYHFYNINAVDILANIIVVPIMGVVLAGGILTGVIGLINIEMARFLSGTVFAILKSYEVVCEFVARMPLSNIAFGKPSWVQLVFIYLAILSLYFVVKKYSLRAIGCVAMSIVCLCVSVGIEKQNAEVAFLYVGQGDCAVISGRYGSYIIDGGGNADKEVGKDTGINTLLPYLKYKGIDSVDAVFVSHMDTDHIKGILEVIGKVGINKIYIPKGSEMSGENYNSLILLCKDNTIDVCEIAKGENVESIFECIYPESDNTGGGNENSLVLKAHLGETDFMFTGDIAMENEKEMLESGEDLGAYVLKVAHHGSNTSSSEDFVREVSPSFAVASAGVNNIYKHPSEGVRKEFENMAIPLFVTSEDGAVIFRTDGKRVWIKRVLGGDKFERVR